MGKKAIKTTKKKRGRPPKYRKAFCKKLIDFFDTEPFEKLEIPHYQKDGRTIQWLDYKIIPARMPTLRKFAKTISVNISKVYEWINPESKTYHSEFGDAFTHAREIRKDWLIDLGLSGMTPPASFKFVAINVTDMVDQTDVTSGGKPITHQTIDFSSLASEQEKQGNKETNDDAS